MALLVPVLPAAAASPSDRSSANPEVRTGDGSLRGQTQGQAEEFLGIPYAAPPVAGLRFRPPQEPRRWSGVRDATHQAKACLQFFPFGLRDPQAVSEDCLYLDVYRPRGARPGARLPVVFWMHGGAYNIGTGTQFGGRAMAELTNTVVVSINYRLGQLGYLALPALTRENTLGSGSWGLMDQIAALKWTRENIAAFGGNPGNITISGQSAGSGSVCAMLTSPQASGLFSRAVLQSGACTLIRTPSRTQAETTGQAFAATAGCPDPATSAACLRTASGADLIAAARTQPASGPAFGDRLLPVQPSEAIAAGDWNKVPVMIGSTRAESRFFVALSQPYLTAKEYTEQITANHGPAASQVLARYPLTGYPSPYLAMSAVLTDSTFACHNYWTAQAFTTQVPTYLYEFDDPNSPTLYGAQVPGVDMTNGHTAELAYLFDFTMSDRPLTEVQAQLGNRMKRYWAAFARSGSPNVVGQTRWPLFGPRGTALTLNTQADKRSTAFASDHQCGFWAALATGHPGTATGRWAPLGHNAPS
ncbi:carboxylesterase family protein [Streptomyces sp. A3M-1-3]|uniref:carboxylesterase/lipase family protein n=1 Tax=Streptomyces sp. A3M-1-3 TaxID=2962044 RepID=UPI0020B822A9|nr:carboxylesterase family protein [Streptomyces sp. A3M-1-3]MCP3818494.1 carboxylesterase family protein [Streptomyces sp. A3M-1-3]